ncbi:hypothetical protein BBK82_08910 [Lentzea guizhouensis]|uniref:Uncharacterized protein n=1 Tax=Lentzea guizhouensis TaxID=1586287 RepID=A0A1B2HEM8_9PSEU|nr:hypothetical protein BBK82_08910 [Lentzea guizhouensis]
MRPPSLISSAPAKAASTWPALGDGWAEASRRQVSQACGAEPPTTGAPPTVSNAARREGSRLSTSSRRADAQPKFR